MGESDKPKKAVLAQASEDAMVVDTMGGRVHVRWDETAQATPQLGTTDFNLHDTGAHRPTRPSRGI
jgi:hypothetical protein